MDLKGNNFGDNQVLVRCAELLDSDCSGLWHFPSGEEIDFAVSLWNTHVLPLAKELESLSNECAGDSIPKSLVDKGRATTKILHYTLRGSIPVLLDNDVDDQCNEQLHPHERATLSAISKSSSSLQTVLRALCHQLSIFVSSLVLTPLGSNTKIVREVCQSFIIICTRRSAQSLAAFQSLSLSRALKKS